MTLSQVSKWLSSYNFHNPVIMDTLSLSTDKHFFLKKDNHNVRTVQKPSFGGYQSIRIIHFLPSYLVIILLKEFKHSVPKFKHLL